MDDLTLSKFSRRSFLRGFMALAAAAAVPVELIERIETTTPAFQAGYQMGQQIVEGIAEGLDFAWIELNGVRYPLEGLTVSMDRDWPELVWDEPFQVPPVKSCSIDCQVELRNVRLVPMFDDLVNFKVNPAGELGFWIEGSGYLTRLEIYPERHVEWPKADFTLSSVGSLTYSIEG